MAKVEESGERANHGEMVNGIQSINSVIFRTGLGFL